MHAVIRCSRGQYARAAAHLDEARARAQLLCDLLNNLAKRGLLQAALDDARRLDIVVADKLLGRQSASGDIQRTHAGRQRAWHVMMGVLIALAALMISLMRGTPSVTFMLATPAK